MTTEFNLSEKRKQTFKANAITEGYHYSYNEEDVKEFIRLCEDNSEEIDGRSYIRVSKMQELAGELK